MNAILIMPPKFLAVFSNREKTRRHSFSQPIRHSTMLRLRYASRSNSTARAARSSFSFDGITGLIPSSSRYSSIQSARIPLVAGQGDRPRDRLAVAVDDPLLGPLQQRDQARRLVRLPGRQVEVQRVAMAVAQQVDLGREAAAGTPQGVVRGLLGIVVLAAPAGTSGGADHGAVDAPQLAIDQAGVDAGGPQSGEDRVQRPVVVPGVEEVPGGGPGAELLGQVAPGGAGPEDPEDAVEDLASIAPGAARASGRGEEVLDELPLLIGESELERQLRTWQESVLRSLTGADYR